MVFWSLVLSQGTSSPGIWFISIQNLLCFVDLWCLKFCLVLQGKCQLLYLIYLSKQVYLCLLNWFLDLKVFPQTLQGSEIPSRWFDSMWSLMAIPSPSFPHTLQISALFLPLGIRFWLFSIMSFTFASSSSKSPPESKSNTFILLSLLVSDVDACFSKVGLAENGMFSRSLFKVGFEFICIDLLVDPVFIFCSISFWSSFCPINPFSFRSSAMARK